MTEVVEQQHQILVQRMEREVLAMEQCLSMRDRKQIFGHMRDFEKLMDELFETEPSNNEQLLAKIGSLAQRRDVVAKAMEELNMQFLFQRVTSPRRLPRHRFTYRGRGH
jgi:hypothetical protein